VVLAATFAVSHNVREAKPLARGALVGQTLDADLARRDWGLQQARPQGEEKKQTVRGRHVKP